MKSVTFPSNKLKFISIIALSLIILLLNSIARGSYKKETPALAGHPSMAGFFRENGYFTARVSKIYHMGVPGGIEWG